jgi:hypothetical protein
MMIGLLSAGGSPGVTSTALGLGSVWPSPVVVVDADPIGGDMLIGAGGGLIAPRGHLLELTLQARQGHLPRFLDQQLTTMPTGVDVLAGLGDPAQAGAVPWLALADGLRAVTHRDVLVDLGRWGIPYAPSPVLRACDVLVLVVRTNLRSLRRAERALPLLRHDLNRHNPGHPGIDLVVVADGTSFSTADIIRRLGTRALGELTHDSRTAAVFSDGAAAGKHTRRSPLVRSLTELAGAAGLLGQQRRATRSPAGRPQDPTPPVIAPPTTNPASGLREMPRHLRRLSAVPPSGGTR